MKNALAIAIVAILPVVAGAGDLIYVLTAANELVLVDSSTPGAAISARPITGLADGERLLTLDFRPENGSLYGISTRNYLYRVDIAENGNAWAMLTEGVAPRLYSINLATGAAVVVSNVARANAIDIAVAPSERIYVLGVAGRVSGANDTLFRTDVRIVNRATTRLPVRLDTFQVDGGSLFVYASVVDNVNGDAIFVPPY